MKTICMINPYFGKLPYYFPIWLRSVEANPGVDFYLITDDKNCPALPNNVKLIQMSFEELKNKIQDCFDFEICLNKAYKLCDFKPAYGEIFTDLIKGYDFWGYCDIDLIFGNIRHFITDEVLNNYNKVLSRGHFTLFKNGETMNSLFRQHIDGGGCVIGKFFLLRSHALLTSGDGVALIICASNTE